MKLSPHYRSDASRLTNDNLRKFMDKAYFKKLENLNYENPKIVVVFAGGNAVGKTTLSLKIQDALRGVVLSNDEMKLYLAKFDSKLDKNDLHKLTWQYSMDLYNRLPDLTPNGLIVRDGVIQWYFHRILPIFKKHGYRIFTVAYDIPKKKAIDLIDIRGDTAFTTTDRLTKIIDDHYVHLSRYYKKYKPDVVLSGDNIFNHDIVISRLTKIIKQTKSL